MLIGLTVMVAVAVVVVVEEEEDKYRCPAECGTPS
jgi:hypothetical protein